MDAIETAIRSAFDKGDALDPAFREKVYRSALTAMERALEANQALTPDDAAQRRDAVRETIDQIESEFVPAIGVAAPSQQAAYAPVPVVETDRPPPAVEAAPRAPSVAPPYAEPRLDAPLPQRSSDASPVRLAGVSQERRRPARRSPGRLWRLLPAVIVIAVVAAAIWWAASQGFFRQPETAGDQPSAGGEQAATAGEESGGSLLPQPASTQDWITVFSPDDPTRVRAPASAAAEVMADDSGRFMRIRSGADGAPVGFDIGQGVLEQLAGKRAVFNIIARVEQEGMPTEISVECDFAALGDCGRRRYSVNYERGDFLFDVELPDGAVAGPGVIAINPDVDNAGKAIDVYEIRVAAE